MFQDDTLYKLTYLLACLLTKLGLNRRYNIAMCIKSRTTIVIRASALKYVKQT